jgi:hypothetical protein
MGTSTSVEQLGQKLVQAGNNVKEARKASFRTAERRMLPRFNEAARQAAGGDRRLSRHRSKAVMTAEFKQVDTETSSNLYINPKGPWRIRDNTDVGGRTSGHTIPKRSGVILKFTSYTGGVTYTRLVNHPGSTRGRYWGEARDESYRFIQTRIPQETIAAIVAALNGAGYSPTS